MEVYEVNAFTRNNKGGNLAGVIIMDNDLSIYKKQEVASILNYSETAFIEDLGDNHFNTSFFTPTQEVDLCGHATIGSFWLLKKLNMLNGKEVFQHTKQGILRVECSDYIFMEMSSTKILASVSKEITSKLLNIDEHAILNTPRIIEVGLADCMVIIKDLETLQSINIDKTAMANYCLSNNFIGFHVATLDNHQYYVRNFAPSCGIDEESATGTANGGMYVYLQSKGYIKGDETITFYQGDNMNSPSEIVVKNIDNKIWVGGQATLNKEFNIY
ncbi:MAG: PhzF family phenazine biosynthesis protein [Bacilli bacterium]|nr:PhzF family phenazine biosynthesis protein [Bacilli bacterium]